MDASQRMILYVLGVSGKPVERKVDIQKIVFLSMMSFPDVLGDVYTFQKHKKGPYSEKVDEDVNVLSNSGFITGSGFGLSDRGREVYAEIETGVKEPLKSIVPDYKDFVSGLSEDELLTFIYTTFPEYTENSEEWDRLKPDRVKHAVSMLKKGAITASRAAEIADMGYYEFEDRLREQKIRWKS